MLDKEYKDFPPRGDNESHCGHACPTVGTHYALVGVPVTVKPFAVPGCVRVECCDSPRMESGEQCRGKTGAVCHFTISQLLKIEIPIDFGAVVKINEAQIECGRSSVESCEGC